MSLAVAGTAFASNAPIYTTAGVNAVSGWYAFSPNEVDFTHITSYIGNDGTSRIEQFPADTALAGTPQGTALTAGQQPSGAAGLGLCDRGTGQAAQVGVVNIGGGLMDVVAAAGTFTSPALSNSDLCENGLLGANGSTATYETVLLSNVPVNDTVNVQELYDPNNTYNFDGSRAQGSVTFAATDLMHNTHSNVLNDAGAGFSGMATDEADVGAVANTAPATALSLPVPAPDSNVNLLVRFAHVKVSANAVGGGHHETRSNSSFQGGAAWSVTPVASSSTGDAAGALYEDPSVFFNDHFSEFVGPGIVIPA
jgi:hypothetical protein